MWRCSLAGIFKEIYSNSDLMGISFSWWAATQEDVCRTRRDQCSTETCVWRRKGKDELSVISTEPCETPVESVWSRYGSPPCDLIWSSLRVESNVVGVVDFHYSGKVKKTSLTFKHHCMPWIQRLKSSRSSQPYTMSSTQWDENISPGPKMQYDIHSTYIM